MKRFKTRQEYGCSVSMRYGEPLKGLDHLHYGANCFTTDPHPYEGKSFKIKVTPEESEKVQKKAFALGYSWGCGDKNVSLEEGSYLYILSDKTIGWGDTEEFFRRHEGDELTPQQFLDGDLPTEACGDEDSGWPQWRLDAYISRSNTLVWWDRELHSTLTVSDAYKYNLMSEADFKAKHPDKPKLKFKNWEVTVEGENINVGCKSLTKAGAKAFYEFANDTGGHHPTPSLDEVYTFIHRNKKQLGL